MVNPSVEDNHSKVTDSIYLLSTCPETGETGLRIQYMALSRFFPGNRSRSIQIDHGSTRIIQRDRHDSPVYAHIRLFVGEHELLLTHRIIIPTLPIIGHRDIVTLLVCQLVRAELSVYGQPNPQMLL